MLVLSYSFFKTTQYFYLTNLWQFIINTKNEDFLELGHKDKDWTRKDKSKDKDLKSSPQESLKITTLIIKATFLSVLSINAQNNKFVLNTLCVT